MNKFICLLAVSVVCLCGTAHALTEVWHVSLTNSSDGVTSCFARFGGYGAKVIPDGSGGVACAYMDSNNSNVVIWVNAKGQQIYSRALPSSPEGDSYVTIIGLDKNHLVYSLDQTGCTVVDRLGRETPVPNSLAPSSSNLPSLPLGNDKNGFFIIRGAGDGSADLELVRFTYK